jgi:hypothetical protein
MSVPGNKETTEILNMDAANIQTTQLVDRTKSSGMKWQKK